MVFNNVDKVTDIEYNLVSNILANQISLGNMGSPLRFVYDLEDIARDNDGGGRIVSFIWNIMMQYNSKDNGMTDFVPHIIKINLYRIHLPGEKHCHDENGNHLWKIYIHADYHTSSTDIYCENLIGAGYHAIDLLHTNMLNNLNNGVYDIPDWVYSNDTRLYTSI